MSSAPTAPDVIATRRNRLPLVALLIANIISLSGNQLAAVAVPWFVLQTTGSAVLTGVTAFVNTVPMIIGAFFGSAIADRIGHKQASVISDLLSGVTVAAIPLLYNVDLLPFWLLQVLVFLGALLDTPGNTARRALLPELAVLAGTRLERANAAVETVTRGSLLIGPLLAGILISVVGAHNVLLIDATTFAFSAALIGLFVPVISVAAKSNQRYLSDVLGGWQFLRRSRMLLVLILSVTVSNFLLSPLFSVVIPVYVQQTYGNATNLGVLIAAFGAGAVIGGIGYGAIGHRVSRWMLFQVGFGVGNLLLIPLALLPPLWIMLIAVLLTGVVSGPLNPMISTLLQERTPADLRARVIGTVVSLALIATPLGMLLAGVLLDQIGVQATLVAITVCSLMLSVWILWEPALRAMDEPTDQIEQASA